MPALSNAARSLDIPRNLLIRAEIAMSPSPVCNRSASFEGTLKKCGFVNGNL